MTSGNDDLQYSYPVNTDATELFLQMRQKCYGEAENVAEQHTNTCTRINGKRD